MQTYTSGSERYSLQYPDNWKYYFDEDTLTFHDEGDGVGAFQITEFEFEEGVEIDLKKQLAESICEFHDLPMDKVLARIQQDGIKAWTSFESEETYWQYWHFYKDHVLLFITYNCEIADKPVEEEIVKQMADSIKFA